MESSDASRSTEFLGSRRSDELPVGWRKSDRLSRTRGTSLTVPVLELRQLLQVRALLTEFLRSQGYEVREAQTAVEALAEARAWHPHVVLLDLTSW